MTTTNASPIRATYRINPPKKNYMKKAVRLAITIPVLALSLSLSMAIALGTYRAFSAPPSVSPGNSITVQGCPTEDSCLLDYHQGEWTIIPTIP